jgi:hypothetical protein
MVFCQSFKACADVTKLVNFIQDSFKSHGCAPFTGAKRKKTSDELLSSEDLKEEKVITTPLKSIPRGRRPSSPVLSLAAHGCLSIRAKDLARKNYPSREGSSTHASQYRGSHGAVLHGSESAAGLLQQARDRGPPL